MVLQTRKVHRAFEKAATAACSSIKSCALALSLSDWERESARARQFSCFYGILSQYFNHCRLWPLAISDFARYKLNTPLSLISHSWYYTLRILQILSLFIFADLLCSWGYSAAQSRWRACVFYWQHSQCSSRSGEAKWPGLGAYMGRSFTVLTYIKRRL